MSSTTLEVEHDLARATAWMRTCGIALSRWPHSMGASPSALPHPLIYVLDPEADPPSTIHELEDWVRLPLDPDELRSRASALLGRARAAGVSLTTLDDGLFRVGDQTVVLSPLESWILGA